MVKIDFSNEIESLKDKLWITKKSRMESEARMKKNANLSTTIIAYYTFFVLSFSIWALVLDVTKRSTLIVNVAAVIASVGLFGLSLLISTFNHIEKAFQYKHSYLSLDELEHKISHFSRRVPSLTDDQILDELNCLEIEYNNILSKTENHERIDYIKMLIDKNHSRLTTGMNSEYKIYLFKNNIIKIFIFCAPPIVAIATFLINT
ncbi:SLATT domain-containing protein [Paenibacillus sp. FSL R10-2199]|uniref:SLATT domain-containing protein n=1 Tax=Paenibacillus sp. FSL R10-2199 TaxID=2975348 RepID=UPI0030F9F8D8